MRSRLVQVIAAVCCLGLILASSTFIRPINEGRQNLNMMGAVDATEAAPAEYAFWIQAFGAFRGLITNMAFIRAEQFKNEGRFYDAMQLASWICALQPRFPSVWEFHSWNMAWNISVTTYTPEERWHWVYNGAKLLRDEGLKYNPRAVNLYRQLAWIFVNKMSDHIDEYHMTYKLEWAYRMHLVLGPPPDPMGDYRPDQPFEGLKGGVGTDPLAEVAEHHRKRKELADPNYLSREDETADSTGDEKSGDEPSDRRPLEFLIVRKAAFDRLKAIGAAPAKLADLFEQTPATREMVARLRELDVRISDDVLSEDEYWQAGSGLAHTFFKRFRQLDDPAALLARISKVDPEAAPTEDEKKLKRFDEIVGVTSKNPDGRALLRFLQRKVLLEVYKLDPDKMAELVETFGPMDWRLVDAHSVYWVNEGLIASDETMHAIRNDKINTIRLIFFSLRNLYHRNRFVFEPNWEDRNKSYMNFNLDLNFVETMHQAYMTYGKLLDPDLDVKKGVGQTFRTGHINFLSESICMLYFSGREREAAHYYDFLRTTYNETTEGQYNKAFEKPLSRYVRDYFTEEIDGHRETRYAVNSFLERAYTALMQGNIAEYEMWANVALDLHSRYNAEHAADRTAKLLLPPFNEYQVDILRSVLLRPGYSPAIVADKARLWQYLPLYLKQAVYDELLPLFTHECGLAQFTLANAFPEPLGMEEFRKSAGRELPTKEQDENVETPAQQPG